MKTVVKKNALAHVGEEERDSNATSVDQLALHDDANNHDRVVSKNNITQQDEEVGVLGNDIFKNSNISSPPGEPAAAAADTPLGEEPADNIEQTQQQMMSGTQQRNNVAHNHAWRLVHAKNFCQALIVCVFLVLVPTLSSLSFLTFDKKECKNTAKEKQESELESFSWSLFVALAFYALLTICSPVLETLLESTELVEETVGERPLALRIRIQAMLKVLLSVILLPCGIGLKHIEIYSCIEEENFYMLTIVFGVFFAVLFIHTGALARKVWEEKWCIYWWNWNDDDALPPHQS
jgi:di/tricarboxylate transporter